MRLADIFTDNMVLQRNKSIAVFGYGKGTGSIEFCGKTTEFESKEDKFCVYLPAEKEGGPYEMKVTLDGETNIFTNILIGDVYLAAGQSNMAMSLQETVDIESVENANVRIFTEPHFVDEDLNVTHKPSPWKECDAESIRTFSAIGYSFGHIVNTKTNVPIGVISSNKGASRIDAWTDPEIVAKPSYKEMMGPKHNNSRYKFNHDCWLYINKILPIVPYTLNGILWYQGESNRGLIEAPHYDKLLEILIENWRDLWKENLPFYCVQIMPYDEPAEKTNQAAIRKGVELVSKRVDNVYMTSVVRTDEEKFIHPTKKYTASLMLANAVLNTLYGFDVIYCGPVFKSLYKKDDCIEISFFHSEGLNCDGEALEDIFVYDAENTRYIANCKIEGEKLIVSCEPDIDIKKITMGYANVPRHNLYNAAGFLAAPFEIEI